MTVTISSAYDPKSRKRLATEQPHVRRACRTSVIQPYVQSSFQRLRRCVARGHVLDQAFEHVEADGLGQMGGEPRLTTFLDVVLRAEPGHRDAWDFVASPDGPHQI